MKIVFVLLYVASAYGEDESTDGKITHMYRQFSLNPFDGFHEIFNNPSKDKNLQLFGTDEKNNFDLYAYEKDPTLVFITTKGGKLIGIQVCFPHPKVQYPDIPLVIETFNHYESKIYDSKEYACTTFFLYHPENQFWHHSSTCQRTPNYSCQAKENVGYFKHWGGFNIQGIIVEGSHIKDRLKKGDIKHDSNIMADGIYFKINEKWTQCPVKENDAEKMGYNEQGCLQGMGKHYFYGMTKKTNCSRANGPFVLYEKCELVGFGFYVFVKADASGYKKYYEQPDELALRVIVPDHPQCLIDWTKKYQLTTMHFYITKHPRLISCPLLFKKDCKKESDNSFLGLFDLE